MNQVKITPVNFAMQAGVYLGVLGIIRFFAMAYSLDNPFIRLFYLAIALFYHIVVYRQIKKYTIEVCDGYITFFEAWNVGLLIYFFASLLTGAFEFIYFKYINPSFISEISIKTLSMIKELSALITDPSAKSMLVQYSALVQDAPTPTAIQMVFEHIQSAVLAGIFVSVILALILARKSKKNGVETPDNNAE